MSAFSSLTCLRTALPLYFQPFDTRELDSVCRVRRRCARQVGFYLLIVQHLFLCSHYYVSTTLLRSTSDHTGPPFHNLGLPSLGTNDHSSTLPNEPTGLYLPHSLGFTKSSRSPAAVKPFLWFHFVSPLHFAWYRHYLNIYSYNVPWISWCRPVALPTALFFKLTLLNSQGYHYHPLFDCALLSLLLTSLVLSSLPTATILPILKPSP